MSPIAHSGIALLGWQLAARRKNVLTTGLFLYLRRGSLKARATFRNVKVLALETAVCVLPVVLAFRKLLVREIGSRGFWSFGRNAS